MMRQNQKTMMMRVKAMNLQKAKKKRYPIRKMSRKKLSQEESLKLKFKKLNHKLFKAVKEQDQHLKRRLQLRRHLPIIRKV